MNFVSVNPTWNLNALKRIVEYIQAGHVLPLAAGLKVRLCQAVVAINPETLLATFVAAEATFSGYPVGGAVPTFSAGGVNIAPNYFGPVADLLFTESSPATITNVLTGWFLESTDADLSPTPDWLLAENFPTPIAMANAFDYLNLKIFMPLQKVASLVF